MNQELCGCSLTRFRWSQFQPNLFSISTDCVTATLGTPEQRLRHNLSQDYHPTVRPVLTPNDIINITFSFRFSRIVSLVRESSSALTKMNFYLEVHSAMVVIHEMMEELERFPNLAWNMPIFFNPLDHSEWLSSHFPLQYYLWIKLIGHVLQFPSKTKKKKPKELTLAHSLNIHVHLITKETWN